MYETNEPKTATRNTAGVSWPAQLLVVVKRRSSYRYITSWPAHTSSAAESASPEMSNTQI